MPSLTSFAAAMVIPIWPIQKLIPITVAIAKFLLETDLQSRNSNIARHTKTATL